MRRGRLLADILLEVAQPHIDHHQRNDAENDAGVVVVPTDTRDAVDGLDGPIANNNNEWKQRADERGNLATVNFMSSPAASRQNGNGGDPSDRPARQID